MAMTLSIKLKKCTYTSTKHYKICCFPSTCEHSVVLPFFHDQETFLVAYQASDFIIIIFNLKLVPGYQSDILHSGQSLNGLNRYGAVR